MSWERGIEKVGSRQVGAIKLKLFQFYYWDRLSADFFYPIQITDVTQNEETFQFEILKNNYTKLNHLQRSLAYITAYYLLPTAYF